MDTRDIVQSIGSQPTEFSSKHSEVIANDLWERNKKKASRNGQMMLFDALRVALGGADGQWGRKVFYKILVDIQLLEKCDTTKGTSSTYCPTNIAYENMPELFFYDADTNMWGFSNTHMQEIQDKIVPVMARRAVKVREMYAEQKKLRAAAARAMKDNGKDTLF